jgi:hypothetical protein
VGGGGALKLIGHTEGEKGALRKIVGPKRDEMKVECRKFCNEGRRFVFHASCFYDNKIKEDEIGRACGIHREEEKCLQNLGDRILREDTE